MAADAPSGAAAWIFALLFALNLFVTLHRRFAQKDQLKPRERALLKEIKELHRSADELSSPDTFAKSAKLKRAAAAKENELATFKEKLPLERSRWDLLSSAFLNGLKMIVYLLLAQQFWHTSVADMPAALLKPSEYLLYTGKRDVTRDIFAVGIVPWLILCSRVSEFLSERLCENLRRCPRSEALDFAL